MAGRKPTTSQPNREPGSVQISWTRPPAPGDEDAVNRILAQHDAGSDDAEPEKVAAWLQCQRERKRSRQFSLKEALAGMALACVLLTAWQGFRQLGWTPWRELLFAGVALFCLASLVAYPSIPRRWLIHVLAIDAFAIALGVTYGEFSISGFLVPIGLVAFVCAWVFVGRNAHYLTTSKTTTRW